MKGRGIAPLPWMALSSEIFVPVGSCPGCVHAWRQHRCRVMASGDRRPGVEGPFALHNTSSRQPVRPWSSWTHHEAQSCPSEYARQASQAREANDHRESEGCIVPLKLEAQSSGSKPGNAGAGKASKPVRVATEAPSGHSAGLGAVSRRPRTGRQARRCWWGAGCVNGARPVLGGARGPLDMDQILWHHQRKRVDNRENEPYPKSERPPAYSRTAAVGVLDCGWRITGRVVIRDVPAVWRRGPGWLSDLARVPTHWWCGSGERTRPVGRGAC